MWPESVVLLGAGKVGQALAAAFVAEGIPLEMVWNRTAATGEQLGTKLGLPWSDQLSALPKRADLYILSVSDDAISGLSRGLAGHVSPDSLVVHTSGATPSGAIGAHFPRFGVFYPLQSFSAGREPAFRDIPLCVFSPRAEDERRLYQLAERLSERVEKVDDRQRAILHVAAVFANNFTNYLQHISRRILTDAELPADLLQPLLRETIEKLSELSPTQAQTGPALRGDQATIQRHLAFLEQYPEWREIYQLLSAEIAP